MRAGEPHHELHGGKDKDIIPAGLNSQSAIRLYKVKLSTAKAQNTAIQEALNVKSKKADKLEKELQDVQKEKAGLEKSLKLLEAEVCPTGLKGYR
jgi:hypothetical protein